MYTFSTHMKMYIDCFFQQVGTVNCSYKIQVQYMLKIFLKIPKKHCDELTGKKLKLSSLSFNNAHWGTTKRCKWPSYDVEGHEDDFNRRFRLKNLWAMNFGTIIAIQDYKHCIIFNFVKFRFFPNNI